jgi:hypothetical protein
MLGQNSAGQSRAAHYTHTYEEATMADPGFWPKVFADLPRDHGHPYLDDDHLTDQYLAKLRQKITREELPAPPAGTFTTDPTQALNTCNRMELQRAFAGYLRRVGGIPIRAYVPILPDGYDGRDGFQLQARGLPWAATADDATAARRHAEYRLAAGVATAVTLHGAALMQCAGLTADQVGAAAKAAVDRAVERLAEQEAPKPKPQAA